MAKPHTTGVRDAPDADALGEQQAPRRAEEQQQQPNPDREAAEPEQRRALGEHDGGDLVGDVPNV